MAHDCLCKTFMITFIVPCRTPAPQLPLERLTITPQLLNADLGKIVNSSNTSFLNEHSALIDQGYVVHHGVTEDSRLVGKVVGVLHESTAAAEPIPPPWDDEDQLSAEYMAKAGQATLTGTADMDPKQRYKRAALADADAHHIPRPERERPGELPLAPRPHRRPQQGDPVRAGVQGDRQRHLAGARPRRGVPDRAHSGAAGVNRLSPLLLPGPAALAHLNLTAPPA